MMARPGGELTIAERAQLPRQRLLADRNGEFVPHPLRQIDQPPTHHAMHRRKRAAFNHAGDSLPLSLVQLGRGSRRFAVDKAGRPFAVEPQHPPEPVEGRERSEGRPRRSAPRLPASRRRRSPPAPTADASDCRSRIASPIPAAPQRHNHPATAQHSPWQTSSFAMLNQNRPDSGIPSESASQGLGIRPLQLQPRRRCQARHRFP